MQGNPMLAALAPMIAPMMRAGIGDLAAQMTRIEAELRAHNELLRRVIDLMQTAPARAGEGNGHDG